MKTPNTMKNRLFWQTISYNEKVHYVLMDMDGASVKEADAMYVSMMQELCPWSNGEAQRVSRDTDIEELKAS